MRPNQAIRRTVQLRCFAPLLPGTLIGVVGPDTRFRTSHPEDRAMTKYLISFPGSAMDISDEDIAAVGEAARAVMREAKNAGIYVFGGGINEDVAPLMVAADGTVTNETYPQTREFDGGFCVLELPSREAAVQWAAKIAKACRCSQELREFGYDPES
jgi:hypothetical protein